MNSNDSNAYNCGVLFQTLLDLEEANVSFVMNSNDSNAYNCGVLSQTLLDLEGANISPAMIFN